MGPMRQKGILKDVAKSNSERRGHKRRRNKAAKGTTDAQNVGRTRRGSSAIFKAISLGPASALATLATDPWARPRGSQYSPEPQGYRI